MNKNNKRLRRLLSMETQGMDVTPPESHVRTPKMRWHKYRCTSCDTSFFYRALRCPICARPTMELI